MAHSDAQDRDWFCSQIFAKPEIFVESDSIRLLIRNVSAPEVWSLFSFLNRSDSVFPLVAVSKEMSVNDTAARKADEGRVHFFEHFSKVLSQAVRLVFVDVGHKKRGEININFSCLVSVESDFSVESVCRRCQREFIFFPLICDSCDFC